MDRPYKRVPYFSARCEYVSFWDWYFDDILNDDKLEDIIDVQPTRKYFNLRPTRKRNYSNMQLLQDAVIFMNYGRAKENVFKHLTGVIMTRINWLGMHYLTICPSR